MSAIQSVGEIQETRKYDIFKLVKGNREINRSHVNRLKEKISRKSKEIFLVKQILVLIPMPSVYDLHVCQYTGPKNQC